MSSKLTGTPPSASHRNLPIFNAPMLHKNIYLVNDPALIIAAERMPKALSFGPFIVALLPRLFDVDSRVMKYISNNVDGSQGKWGFIHDITQGMHHALAPNSPNLDAMIKVTLQRMLDTLDKLSGTGDSNVGEEIELFAWVRKDFAIASTDAIYGPKNPFSQNPNLQNDFWTVDAGFASLLLSPFPRLFARSVLQARERIRTSVQGYLSSGGEQAALGVFKARAGVFRKYGGTEEDITKLDLTNLIGVLINATPMLFWGILHIYSSPSLLHALREEIDAVVRYEINPFSEAQRRILDVKSIQSACPLLNSTFKEMLRYYTHTATNRAVLSDIILADRYRLKKGSILCIPGATVHFNPNVWGPDAHVFKPDRFLPRPDGKKTAPSGAGAWRVWGGGATICPGRHFASQEVTAILAMCVARFEIEPVGGKAWGDVWPEVNYARIMSSIHPPKGDVKVRIRTRRGLEDVQWGYGYEMEAGTEV